MGVMVRCYISEQSSCFTFLADERVCVGARDIVEFSRLEVLGAADLDAVLIVPVIRLALAPRQEVLEATNQLRVIANVVIMRRSIIRWCDELQPSPERYL